MGPGRERMCITGKEEEEEEEERGEFICHIIDTITIHK